VKIIPEIRAKIVFVLNIERKRKKEDRKEIIIIGITQKIILIVGHEIPNKVKRDVKLR
jgi:hypothetical protein